MVHIDCVQWSRLKLELEKKANKKLHLTWINCWFTTLFSIVWKCLGLFLWYFQEGLESNFIVFCRLVSHVVLGHCVTWYRPPRINSIRFDIPPSQNQFLSWGGLWSWGPWLFKTVPKTLLRLKETNVIKDSIHNGFTRDPCENSQPCYDYSEWALYMHRSLGNLKFYLILDQMKKTTNKKITTIL